MIFSPLPQPVLSTKTSAGPKEDWVALINKYPTMKSSLLASLLLLAVGSTNAWVTPTRRFLEGAATAAGIAGAVALAPITANAIEGSFFSHQYEDPKHPNCKRIVVVRPDATVALSGTDGNPGCPADGSGNIWRLSGEVDGNAILVDFSAKVNKR